MGSQSRSTFLRRMGSAESVDSNSDELSTFEATARQGFWATAQNEFDVRKSKIINFFNAPVFS